MANEFQLKKGKMKVSSASYQLPDNRYEAIVIGTSAGGMFALTRLLTSLPEDFSLPLIIVQHVHSTQDNFMIKHFNDQCHLTVKEANAKEAVQPKSIYFAPPNYHLLIEQDKTFALSTDERVNYSRPSIDVLFESAADVYGSELIGIILTGSNDDGSKGLKRIQEDSGLTIVQDPDTAEHPVMPCAAIDIVEADYILPLEGITNLLIKVSKKISVSCS